MLQITLCVSCFLWLPTNDILHLRTVNLTVELKMALVVIVLTLLYNVNTLSSILGFLFSCKTISEMDYSRPGQLWLTKYPSLLTLVLPMPSRVTTNQPVIQLIHWAMGVWRYWPHYLHSLPEIFIFLGAIELLLPALVLALAATVETLPLRRYMHNSESMIKIETMCQSFELHIT